MQVVVITGGSGGIGAAAARECARRGMGVIIAYRSHRDAAEQIVAGIEAAGGQAAMLPLDVADTASFDIFAGGVAAKLAEKWPSSRLHGIVNNAGTGLFMSIEEMGEEDFDALYRVHLKGPFFLTQKLLPLLADGGAIVNITSATERVATPGVAPYASFKGGLAVLTRYMAKEFATRRIRANAVSPGAIRTELAGGIPPEFERQLADRTALGRIGEAEDVGRVIANLLSDDLLWVNAQTIEVSGGFDI